MRPTEAQSNRTPPSPDPRVTRQLALARAVVGWERLWPAIWIPVLLLAAFVGTALLGLPHALGSLTGGWGHLALLVGFAAAFLWTLRRGIVAWRPAAAADAVRRVERDSALAHRPISGLSDRLAGAGRDPAARALWEAHRRRQEASLAGLRVAPPEPAMFRLDPFGVRSAVGLVVVAGLAVAAPDPLGRMADAFQPTLTPLVTSVLPTLDVWINPPAYTGRPPMLLARAGHPVAGAPAGQATGPGDAGTPKRLAVPTGAVLLAKVNGGSAVPSLAFATRDGESVKPFERVAEQAFQIETPITAGTALAIRQDGDELAAWTITVLPDLRPTVAFAEDPQPTERAALMIHYTASDDYGLAAVEARIRRLDQAGQPTAEEPVLLAMTLPGNGLEAADAKDFHDLTPHPWAGHPVAVTLVARDEAGQEGTSEPVRMTLPEREFTHPVARAIIEQRKRLVTEPKEKADIADVLMSLAARPQHYYDDPVTFLALRLSAGRLVMNDATPAMLADVQSLLWDTALRVEDGELSLAARELRELERRLMEMLAQDNPDEQELEQLMEELKQAIDKYLQAMMEQLQQQRQNGEQQEMQDADPSRMVERQDLMDMVDRAREMMKSGAKDAARKLLSQLREMMENLRAGRPQMMSPEQQAAQEMMRQLQELAERQQRLMDETYRSQQEGAQREGQEPGDMAGQPREGQGTRPGQRPGQQGQRGAGTPQGADRSGRQSQPGMGDASPEALARMQEELRRQLGEFMRKLGEGMGQIPQPFGEAERAMKDAGDALGRSQPGEAVGPQGDAVERLQDGAQALAESMRQNQQANGGTTPDPNAQGRSEGDQRRDPLRDRPNQGYASDESSVEIPGESDLQRARRIFDELRKRSGERSRPELELDYIERLLKRF